jgi:hypothetical protein
MKRNHSYNGSSLWISVDALPGLLMYMKWPISYLLSGILPPLLLSERTGSQSLLNASQRSKADTYRDIIMSEQNVKIQR